MKRKTLIASWIVAGSLFANGFAVAGPKINADKIITPKVFEDVGLVSCEDRLSATEDRVETLQNRVNFLISSLTPGTCANSCAGYADWQSYTANNFYFICIAQCTRDESVSGIQGLIDLQHRSTEEIIRNVR